MTNLKLCYILPAHNESLLLKNTVEKLSNRLEQFAESSIIIGENASTDGTFELAKKLEGQNSKVKVFAFHESQAGIGYGLHRGLSEALKIHNQEDYWFVLNGADLPFEFSDLESFIKELQGKREADVYVGSKSHRESVLTRTLLRRIMSLAFWFLRKVFLGMKTMDSQGSIFLKAKVARIVVDRVLARNFFYTTELIYFAEREGFTVKEVKIVLNEEKRKTKVRVLKSSFEMIQQIIRLFARTS